MFGGRPQMMTGSSSSTAVGSKGGATTTLYVLLLDRAEVPKQAPMVPFLPVQCAQKSCCPIRRQPHLLFHGCEWWAVCARWHHGLRGGARHSRESG